MMKCPLWFILFVMFFALPTQAQEPEVYAILFYSPTCPHCHAVINDHLPGIQNEFGDQLKVLFVNVTTQGGATLFYSTCDALEIPDNRCGGVPMMVIGDTVLFGDVEIPEQMPSLVREGLANGGIAIPAIPGMKAAYDAWLATQPTEETNEVITPSTPDPIESSSLKVRLAADPEANALAVAVLLGLMASFGFVVTRGTNQRVMQSAIYLSAGVGIALAVSIITHNNTDESLPKLIAWSVVLLLGSALIFLNRKSSIPLVALAGIAVAAYLAHIETTSTEAICGLIGNCNTVQQSEYARILGVPIGVIGVFGYTAMLLAWVASNFKKYRQLANTTLLLMALVGTAFSIYLTFLEPFVIGATCAWCLMSAIAMLLLLWLVSPLTATK